MSTLRLPLIGDFIYVSPIGDPDVERKYIVTGETEDGYLITPEDTRDVTSLIQYKFVSKKWVVAGAEDDFNVRLELNPELYDPINVSLWSDDYIQGLIINGEFDQAKQRLDQYQAYGDLIAVSVQSNESMERDEPLYSLYLQEPNRIDIFNWLQHNYVVDYVYLLREIINLTRIESNEIPLDVLEWLLDQDVKWSWSRNDNNYIPEDILDTVNKNVMNRDLVDIFRLLTRIPGFIESLEKYSGRNIIELAKRKGATKIFELLQGVPTKSARKQ